MSCASFTIICMKIKLENNSVLFCSIGAVAGMILGKLFLLKGTEPEFENDAQK